MDRRSKDLITRQRRPLLVAALTLVALGLFAAAGAIVFASPSSSAQTDRLLPPPNAEAVLAKVSAAPQVGQREMPNPARILIPAIGVSARVIPLGLNRDRTLEVPKNFAEAGWFVGGPEPGERGAAVIVGHVDSRRGPAVFYRLRALRAGDKIKVVLRNRSSVRFVVRATKAVPKRRFPTKLVYAKTRKPTLRLITCDGRFDRSTGHYVDNYIVFASMVGR